MSVDPRPLSDSIPTGPEFITRSEVNPNIINPITGQPYLRFGSEVDLGLVNVRDAIIGTMRFPVSYSDGRLISNIRFTPEGSAPGTSIIFFTPNTPVNSEGSMGGYGGFISGTLYDTFGLLGNSRATAYNGTSISTGSSDANQILDVGPIVLVAPDLSYFTPLMTWGAHKSFGQYDGILDVNDHVQMVQTSGNGVTGSTLPVFSTSGGTTSDGTVTWVDEGIIPGGSLHAIATVMDGASSNPVFPSSMEWVVPPANVVHGTTMPDFSAVVKDNNGNPLTNFYFSNQPWLFYLSLVGNGSWGGGGGLSGDGTWNGTTGVVTFSGISITNPGTGLVFRVRVYPETGLPNLLSPPFNST